jgi:hypothetical protein
MPLGNDRTCTSTLDTQPPYFALVRRFTTDGNNTIRRTLPPGMQASGSSASATLLTGLPGRTAPWAFVTFPYRCISVSVRYDRARGSQGPR